MRLSSLIAALGFATVCAYAQPLADQARLLLQSQSLHDKAWGAWFAGVSHDAALREPLIAALRAAQSLKSSQPDTEAYAYIQALFDSLIQTPGTVASDVILPFETSWRAEVLILLSRDPNGPENEAALLAMRERQMPDPAWAAVNDLLFSVSSKQFFQRTLQEIRITHRFLIVDHEVGSCGGTTACGSSLRRFPKGAPPAALYQLQKEMTPGDSLLVERPVAIYYRRIVVPTDGEVEWNECESSTIPTELRQTWLAQFLAATDWIPAQQAEQLFHAQTMIEWHGAALAANQAAAEMDRQAASIETLIGKAQRRGLLDASGMSLTIKTSVGDVRSDKSEPAPSIASREIVIRQ
jgi:hypothetical protein